MAQKEESDNSEFQVRPNLGSDERDRCVLFGFENEPCGIQLSPGSVLRLPLAGLWEPWHE